MTKKKSRFLLLGLIIALVIFAFAITEFNEYRREHTVFNSQKWKTDITSRYDMPDPVVKGMNKNEVRRLLGKPDRETTGEKETFFGYLMPSGSTKGAEYIYFQNNIVTNTRYDDSADDMYEEKSNAK